MRATAQFRPTTYREVVHWRGRVFCMKAKVYEAMFIYAKD